MAETTWAGLEATFVTKLRETKTEPVPDEIVKLAQRSLTGIDQNGTKLHAMQLEFETAERATAFAKHMRNAGPHTDPASSISVVIDPERRKVQDTTADGKPRFNDEGKAVMVDGPAVNPKLVAFRAGPRRGKAPANGS